MAKMGRPKQDVVKERGVTVRMSNEEHQKLKAYSERHQQTISETIKEGINLLYQAEH